MSLNARLAKIERGQAAGPQYPGGTLIAERSTETDAGAAVGMFRCQALDGAAAGFTRTEAELERIADERKQLLILVLREHRPIATV